MVLTFVTEDCELDGGDTGVGLCPTDQVQRAQATEASIWGHLRQPVPTRELENK